LLTAIGSDSKSDLPSPQLFEKILGGVEALFINRVSGYNKEDMT